MQGRFLFLTILAILGVFSATIYTIWSLETGNVIASSPVPRSAGSSQVQTLEPIFMPEFVPISNSKGEKAGNVKARAALGRAERLATAGRHEEASSPLRRKLSCALDQRACVTGRKPDMLARAADQADNIGPRQLQQP